MFSALANQSQNGSIQYDHVTPRSPQETVKASVPEVSWEKQSYEKK